MPVIVVARLEVMRWRAGLSLPVDLIAIYIYLLEFWALEVDALSFARGRYEMVAGALQRSSAWARKTMT